MVIDFKDISFMELVNIRDQINEELEERRVNKSSIYSRKITEQFEKDWASKGIRFWDRGKFNEHFYASIYKVCDFTLENYKLVDSSLKNGKQIKLNGSRITIKDPRLYERMSGEIFDVIKKYYKESHGHEMTRMTEEERELLGKPEEE